MRITVTGRQSASVETETPTFELLAQLAAASESRIAPVVVFAWESREFAVSSADPESAVNRIEEKMRETLDAPFREQLHFAAAALAPYVSGQAPSWV